MDAALKEVKKVVSGDDNVMPTLVEAVKKDATLGEIIGVMKTVFGESLH